MLQYVDYKLPGIGYFKQVVKLLEKRSSGNRSCVHFQKTATYRETSLRNLESHDGHIFINLKYNRPMVRSIIKAGEIG